MKNIIKETYESWCWLCDYLASCQYSHQYLINKWHIAQWMLLIHWLSETLMHWTCFAKLGKPAKERQAERLRKKASKRERAILLEQIDEFVAKGLAKLTVTVLIFMNMKGLIWQRKKYLWLVITARLVFFFSIILHQFVQLHGNEPFGIQF